MTNVQCSAISSRLTAKGYDSAKLAGEAGINTQRVDAILSGQAKATPQEFSSIARVLGLPTADHPSDNAHVTA